MAAAAVTDSGSVFVGADAVGSCRANQALKTS